MVDTADYLNPDATWVDVCQQADLEPDSGVCALVDGQQVAIFYLSDRNAVYAIHNYDPIGKANVLSKGIVGDINNELVVASPLYKHHFSLTTGRCLENEDACVAIYTARLFENKVQIRGRS